MEQRMNFPLCLVTGTAGTDKVRAVHADPDRLLPVPLFAGVSDEDRERLASWMEVEEYPMGKALTHEGTSDYEFFVLGKGNIRIEHNGVAVATRGPADVFGELAILGDARRHSDAIAETDVVVFAMFGTRFREMQLSMPNVAERLQDLATERLAQLGS